MLMQNLPAVPGHTFAVLATDGGPNCDTGLTCSVATCTCNIDRCNQLDCGGSTQPCCVPGGANCCGPPFNYTFDCLDSSNTVAAVAALAHAGVRTFAIGVPGSEAYADVLDDVAKAGQTARGTEPYYYPVSSSAAFVAALTDIAARISACTLELKAPPPDSTQVNVVIQKTQVPQTGSDGWTLDGNIVNLLGQTCDDAVAGEDVLVTFGCPTVY